MVNERKRKSERKEIRIDGTPTPGSGRLRKRDGEKRGPATQSSGRKNSRRIAVTRSSKG